MRSPAFVALALVGCTEYDLIGDQQPNDLPVTCTESPVGWDGESDATCENEIQVGSFTPVIKWEKANWSIEPGSNQIMSQPIVASLTDDNADGLVNQDDIPDVITVTYGSSNVVRAISGLDGSELWSYADFAVQGQGGVAAGDIDRDGIVELITLTSDGMIAFEHTGAVKWRISGVLAGHIYGTSDVASITDMDGDGEVEIIAGRAIVRADGSIRGLGAYGRGGTTGGGTNASGNVGTCAFAVDLDRDGTQEVVTGNTLYDPNGGVIWFNSQDDGYPAVGNFDDDPEGEIAVMGQGQMRVLDTNGTIMWAAPVPGAEAGYYGGPPTVADFDGDGEPEIGVASGSRYSVFERDGALKWQAITQDGSSGNTGSAVFDFEGDGAAEAVYADETKLWVFNGGDGTAKLASDHHSNYTWLEYPTIADVDGDGHADIVVPNTAGPGAFQYSGLTVFTDANNSWRPGRKIWNQHAYHITNVNDDGTIPAVAEINWDTYNSFRSGALSSGLDGLTAPDLQIGESDACQLTCTDDGTMTVWAHVGNTGAADVPPGTIVEMYAVVGGNEILVGTATVDTVIIAGQWADGLAVTGTGIDVTTLEALVLRIRSNESQCDETNDEIRVDGPFCE